MSNNLGKLTIEELCAAEKAASIVRKYYEDKSNMFRGVSVTEESRDYNTYRELSSKLAYFNSLRIKIMEEMETRLKKMVGDE